MRETQRSLTIYYAIYLHWSNDKIFFLQMLNTCAFVAPGPAGESVET